MNKPILFTAALAVLALASGSPISAASTKSKHTSVTKRIIRDCSRDGKLRHRYTVKQLKRALRKLPEDIDTYTDCRAAIRREIRRLRRKRRKTRAAQSLTVTAGPAGRAQSR